MEKEPGKYFTLIFDSCLLTGFSGSFFSKKYYEPVANSSSGYYPIPSTPYLQDIFSNLFWIYDHFSEKNPECFLSVQRRLQDIWISLYRNVFHTDPCEEKSGQNARILQMLNYLRQNYPEKFSLSEMAEHLHLSRGECCRFFKKMMGMTISDYLLEYRLGRATELLERTEKSITEIAHEVGFNSVSNFTALFRTKTGLTPSKYRESARNRMK